MQFQYAKQNLTGLEKKKQRLFEMLPGLLSWGILLGIVALSLINPVAASAVAIAFIFYWFLRLIYMTIFLICSFMRLEAETETDWMLRVRGIDRLNAYLGELGTRKARTLNERFSLYIHKKELRFLRDKQIAFPASGDIYHLIIFPVAKESEDVIRPGLEALLHQPFPHRQMLVVYAVEERAPQDTKNVVERLIAEYKKEFLDVFMIVHPDNLPGETRTKGANASYAARRAAEFFAARAIAFEHIIVSCLDADTVVDKSYFACLTYNFIVTPDRTRASFQPIPVYNNNIWDAPWFVRVMEIGSSFFQLIEVTHPEKLVVFSSHSMSFKALTDIGYWPKDIVSDDSAIFWKAYLYYDGNYRAVPLFITVSMDATVSENWWRTLKSIYRQRRRWAYGAENFPILVRGFIASKKIPLREKMGHAFKMLENQVSWATWGFLLTTLGWLPAVLAGREFHKSVVYYNEPHITRTIFHLSSFSLIVSVFLGMLLLPAVRKKYGWLKKVKHIFEWLTIPFVLVLLSALPALDAQTRLLFGRYMEFRVTDKGRRTTL
ncbi:MAG: glycosyltransferase family 2 protein [Candidatus Omnitrophica bacterium]|nr:glycosyltransferase family 2 protein [Candidatus Omnitrophota bacterium]